MPHVVVTHPMGPWDNARLITLLGAVFDRDAQAASLAADVDASLRALRSERARSLPRERVLYLIWRKPWMTVSRDTYVSRTLALAGFDTRRDRERAIAIRSSTTTIRHGATPIASCCRPNRTRFASATRRALRETLGKPVDLIDGEWTSWYGVRAAPARARSPRQGWR